MFGSSSFAGLDLLAETINVAANVELTSRRLSTGSASGVDRVGTGVVLQPPAQQQKPPSPYTLGTPLKGDRTAPQSHLGTQESATKGSERYATVASRIAGYRPARGRARAKQLAGMSAEEIETERLARLERNRLCARECRLRKKGRDNENLDQITLLQAELKGSIETIVQLQAKVSMLENVLGKALLPSQSVDTPMSGTERKRSLPQKPGADDPATRPQQRPTSRQRVASNRAAEKEVAAPGQRGEAGKCRDSSAQYMGPQK